MKRLNIMIVMILFVTFLLVVNAFAVFHYRDGILSCETRKDSMLNFVIKYEIMADSLRSNARFYLATNDEQYITQFNDQLNNYYEMDHISVGYQTFTPLQAKKQLDYIDQSVDFTMKAQADFLRFNAKEAEQYSEFLVSYEKLLLMFQECIDEENPDILTSTVFETQYVDQQTKISELSRIYMHRLNEQEDSVVATQSLTEVTLVLLSILLLLVACILFVFLIKENKWNSYFRKLYTTIVENVNVGLSITDQAGEYEYMNAKYRDILGIDNPNPLRKTPTQILDKELTDVLAEISSGESDRSEGQLRLNVNHDDRYVDYDRFIIYDDNNQKKYVDLLHDITDMEKMQLQLKNQLQEIEFYSHAKDSFLANISHEIKTPINAIVGMTYFLKGTRLSREQQDLVEKIESSSDVLLAIINDVLDLSKIKSRDLTLYPTAFSLADVIHSIEDMFLAQITGKGLDWFCEMNIVPDLCLRLDRTRLIQVLVNVINNAYKFTSQGYIALSVETKLETTDVIHLEFCIEDTGIGIPKQDIPKLFREFEQLENHLTKQHTGTGLGLSICKHIVETMGGRMWVASEVGTGSRFYFTIPAPKADPDEVEASPQTPESTSFDGAGANVLIVEDTEINLEIAENLLAAMNVKCCSATNGLEAIEQCRNRPADFFRVILMDIHMPEMDGYTASEILKNEMGITAPIIALTATEVDDEIGLQHRDTISGFILKPFKVETFYKTLSKYFSPALNNHGAAADSASDSAGNPGDKSGPFAGKAVAIHNLGGMEAIYYKHVAKFKANYPETPDLILGMLERGEMEDARRTAHSVKGLAGTLGMLELQEAAAALEKRIAEGETKKIPAAMKVFSAKLAEVIQAEP